MKIFPKINVETIHNQLWSLRKLKRNNIMHFSGYYSSPIIGLKNYLKQLDKDKLHKIYLEMNLMKIQQTNRKNKGISDLETPGYQHHDGLHFEDYKHQTYKKLAEYIAKNFNDGIYNILELGCGAGSLSYWLKVYNQNYNIITADGNKETINSPYIDKLKHFIIRTDENYHFKIGKKTILFDIVLSYEHLEHIQEDKLDKWFENLNKHSKSGTIFLGTASTLNYNDRVHVLLRDKNWWISEFQKYGWNQYEISVLNSGNKPFNFEMGCTNELTFQKI